MKSPSSRRTRGSAGGASPGRSWKRSRVSPTAMRSPFSRRRSWTGCPLTKVPRRLPRSRRRNPPSSGSTAQWRRETAGSLTWRPLSTRRPTWSPSGPRGKRRPDSGPLSTVSVGCIGVLQQIGDGSVAEPSGIEFAVRGYSRKICRTAGQAGSETRGWSPPQEPVYRWIYEQEGNMPTMQQVTIDFSSDSPNVPDIGLNRENGIQWNFEGVPPESVPFIQFETGLGPFQCLQVVAGNMVQGQGNIGTNGESFHYTALLLNATGVQGPPRAGVVKSPTQDANT